MKSVVDPMDARWREMVELTASLQLTAEQWGAVLVASLREGSLKDAVALVHLAPPQIGAALSAALCAAGPTVLRPANEP